jgi:hypothetical protein
MDFVCTVVEFGDSDAKELFLQQYEISESYYYRIFLNTAQKKSHPVKWWVGLLNSVRNFRYNFSRSGISDVEKDLRRVLVVYGDSR